MDGQFHFSHAFNWFGKMVPPEADCLLVKRGNEWPSFRLGDPSGQIPNKNPCIGRRQTIMIWQSRSHGPWNGLKGSWICATSCHNLGLHRFGVSHHLLKRYMSPKGHLWIEYQVGVNGIIHIIWLIAMTPIRKKSVMSVFTKGLDVLWQCPSNVFLHAFRHAPSYVLSTSSRHRCAVGW